MSGIIYDARRIKAYEAYYELAEYAGKSKEFADELWKYLLEDAALMEEFAYYLDNQTFKDGVKCHNYGLTDLYFYNIRKCEMAQDIGKNYADTNKEGVVLDTFMDMAHMLKAPDTYLADLNSGLGMDKI